MKASEWFIPTLKESPSDAEIVSHKLMLRAGMIRKLGSGLYTWLPLGLKVLRKVETIIRSEMNDAGAIEMLMPTIQPAELWEETGRWQTFGDQLLTMQDSNKRDYCFGPTHEEVITDLMRNELQSYKQLPINFYQIQTKFRDEIRPRFGVMRAREFLMKDAYSFHLNAESLAKTYAAMHKAYCKVFEKIGVDYRVVEADTGAIGGSASHEFQLLAETGEDIIFYSDNSDYAANVEQATSQLPEISKQVNAAPLEIMSTPGIKTIADLAEFLKCNNNESVKTLIVKGTEQPMVALILRGDDDLNPIKAEKHPLVHSPLTMVDEDAVKQNLGVSFGSIGPVKLNIPIIADYNARALASFICGANIDDKHYINAAWERDAKCDDVFDIRNVKNGDISPDGKGKLLSCRGIEVGHIFQLGSKYAKSMQAQVLNENGKLETMLMGCYGLGISRIVAAVIEQFNDEKGIIWPTSIAPFQLVIIPINYKKSERVKAAADKLYQECQELGIEVLLDDRKERPGVLFADNDLLGIPHRVVIGEKLLDDNQVEYKNRSTEEISLIFTDKLSFFLNEIILNTKLQK